jgi:hypothetical protein
VRFIEVSLAVEGLRTSLRKRRASERDAAGGIGKYLNLQMKDQGRA